jgi:hypothetical protein
MLSTDEYLKNLANPAEKSELERIRRIVKEPPRTPSFWESGH